MPDLIRRSPIYNLRFMVWSWLRRQMKGQQKLRLTQRTAELAPADPLKTSVFSTVVKNFNSISIRKYFSGNTVVSLRPILFWTVSFLADSEQLFRYFAFSAFNAIHHPIFINGAHLGNRVLELLNAICRGHKRKIYFCGTCMLRRLFASFSP